MSDQELTPQRRTQLAQAFHVIDTNGDGVVSYEELAAFLRAEGDSWSDAGVRAAFDGSGSIDAEEFFGLMVRMMGS